MERTSHTARYPDTAPPAGPHRRARRQGAMAVPVPPRATLPLSRLYGAWKVFRKREQMRHREDENALA